ncbi:hypothetical protein AGMMS49579_03510 [Spirochaetia bacterium]|nr:hypothetical protein AGMMS49579_03510 [Spirochaetia bacterium]
MRKFLLLLLVCAAVDAEEWYLSNAAGMLLEKQVSRFAALRNKYSLSVDYVSPSELPDLLREYHKTSWPIEVHTLFENGEESRRQWIFCDEKGRSRLVAAFEAAPAPDGKAPVGFIELYDENSLITAEHRFFDEGDEIIINYSYNKDVLIRAETRHKSRSAAGEEVIRHINTDYYRYSRVASLRAVERVYHEKLRSDEGYLVRHLFPHRILDSVGEENFVNPTLAYGSDFLEDVLIDNGYKVLYTTDERGRVIGETHQDNEGNIIGELLNHWSGERLASVTWKTEDEERRTEYKYDSEGDRIEERDYNAGTLERVVRRENKREVEELYMNGVVILRAIWDDGRKISEERVRPNTSGGQR